MNRARLLAPCLALSLGFASVGCKASAPPPSPGPSADAQELGRAKAIIEALEARKRELEAQLAELRRRAGDAEVNARLVAELQKKLAETQGRSRELEGQLEQFAKTTPGTQLTDDKAVRFEESLLFDPGKADLRTEGKAALTKLSQILKSRNVFLRIDGHTDSDPIHSSRVLWRTGSNFELGAYRALAVLLHLEQACGLPAEKMYLASYGQNKPMAANDTKENKKKNRRVEIAIVEK
ncbi:MAG: OmpA family protein [Planctomycetes bacterium]|nr:OmpA family protein [Planctomycetota bacterium]